jgi:predicted dehydrogenase
MLNQSGDEAKIEMSAGNASVRSLAIVGCGAVVEEFYAPALKNLERSGWTLDFVDSDARRAQETATHFRKSAAFDSIDAIVGRASHAIVATPPASHYPLCNQLLEAGIHVLCEKPFVLDPSEGQALVDRAAGADLKLHVNQTRRWFPASLAARRLLCEEAIGDVTSISARFGTRFDWPTKTAFHSHPGLARTGILSDQGAHIFDLIGWILDRELEPIDVKHDGYAGPEMTVCVDFSSGPVRGNAIMTWLVVVPSYVHFVGTKGRIILDDDCNRALLQRESEILEVAGTCRYSSYASIATDLLAAFFDGTDNVSVAPAKSVLPSTTFLDRAYRMAKATLPRVTALG